MNSIKWIAAGVLLLILCITGCSTCTLVSPTEAGFKINKSGDYRGVSNLPLITGYNFYIPWLQQIETIPTTMQHEVWSDSKDEGSPTDQAVTISCKGGAGFKVDVGLNYHVIASDAPKIYLRWKKTDLADITSTFIRNICRGCMQDISGTITVDSVLNNLPAFEHASKTAIFDTLIRYGFYVDNFNVLKQPVPSDPQLAASINAKVKAKQDAETSIMQLQQSIAEANKKVAAARGDSAATLIEAQGKAEAIKALQAQITPTYVDYVKWKDAGDNVPRVPQYVGAGGWIMQGGK